MYFQSSGAYVYHLTSLGGPEMYFQSSGVYVTHAYKFEGPWCI
jgi:hypothetical protein